MAGELLGSQNPVRTLELINEAHLYIMGRCGLIPLTTVNINLTNGTQEYALADGIINIDDAVYYTSATSHFPLRPTNIDSLYEDYGPNWRENVSAGTPYAFYENGGNIGFVPAPGTTTSAGYPIVTLHVLQYTALALTDSLPSTINTVQPYVLYVARDYAMVKEPDKMMYYSQAFEASVKNLQDFVWRRTKRDKPRVMHRVNRVRGA